jgi:uncharacterized membrane protein YdjX (TVP38/TMEM64 family)
VSAGWSARRATWILACALLIPLVPFLILGELPGERWLSAHDGNAQYFAAVGAALLALDVLLPIPSSIVGWLLGARLGFTAGFAAAFVGLAVGNVVGYWLGRLLPQRYAVELPATPSLLALFASRPVPVLAEAAVIAAGVARVDFRGVCISAGLGNALYAALLAWAGAASLPEDWLGPAFLVPFVLPVGAWAVWRISRRQQRA